MRAKIEDAFSYLLGEMTPIQADAFEADLFHDDAHFEELLGIEDDLIDAFVRGDLSMERRMRFETRYLTTAEGRERIANAKTLHNRFRRAPGWMDWLKSLKPKRVRATT